MKRELGATPGERRAEGYAEQYKVGIGPVTAPPRDRHLYRLPVPHDEPRSRIAGGNPQDKSSLDDDPDVRFADNSDPHRRFGGCAEDPSRYDVHGRNVLAHGHQRYEPMARRELQLSPEYLAPFLRLRTAGSEPDLNS